MSRGWVFWVAIFLIAGGLFYIIHSGSKQDKQEPSIYYFYRSTCPNCIATEPFIDYLEKEYGVEINRYEVRDPQWRWLVDYYNITAVPTLIIQYPVDDTVKEWRFVNRLNVPKAEYIIANLTGKPEPKKPYNINMTQLDPMTCAVCHAQRQLPPPSTYSCTSCCHRGGSGE